MRSRPLSVYAADDSGDRAEPHQGSMTEPRNRIDFLTHDSLVKYLSGPSLLRLFERFDRNLSSRLLALNIDTEWKVIPDFLGFIQAELSTAVLEAIMGPQLVAQNPTFVEDLFEYDSAIPILSKGLPRLLYPKAYAIRDRMLSMIKRWYAFAKDNFTEDVVDADGDFDPFWGSEHMRHRQNVLRNVDNFDDDAMASSDLGLIWA